MKKYLIKIHFDKWNDGYRYFTEEELYSKIRYQNNYLKWDVSQFTTFQKHLIKEEFLKTFDNIILLISQFEQVISITSFETK